MAITFFDIETMPNSSMVDRLPAVEVRAGNLKDPAKIAEKMEAARAEQREKMTLNPLYGRICAFVIMFDDGETIEKSIYEDSDKAETELIQSAFEELSGNHVITYNGNGFDLPFLYRRACILDVRARHYGIPTLKDMTAKFSHWHTDLMQEWCGFGQFEKLDNIARVLVGDAKIEIDYKTFPELIKSEEGRLKIIAYCRQDVLLTKKLYDRFFGILF